MIHCMWLAETITLLIVCFSGLTRKCTASAWLKHLLVWEQNADAGVGHAHQAVHQDVYWQVSSACSRLWRCWWSGGLDLTKVYSDTLHWVLCNLFARLFVHQDAALSMRICTHRPCVTRHVDLNALLHSGGLANTFTICHTWIAQVYSAGLDNNITVWDLRKGEQSMSLKGHTDSITGLALNPEGTHLLSNAADNSLRVWDMRPYAPANRCEKIFTGHQHNYERNLLRCSWSPDGSKVTCAQSTKCIMEARCQIWVQFVLCHLIMEDGPGSGWACLKSAACPALLWWCDSSSTATVCACEFACNQAQQCHRLCNILLASMCRWQEAVQIGWCMYGTQAPGR